MSRLQREQVEQAKATGEMPLDYFLRLMRCTEIDGEGKPVVTDARRDAAAAHALPYLHSKMPQAIVTPPPADQDITDDDESILQCYLSGIHADTAKQD